MTREGDQPLRSERFRESARNALLEREPVWAREFTDLSHEWRRLFGELLARSCWSSPGQARRSWTVRVTRRSAASRLSSRRR